VEQLSFDIELIQYLAQQVLIAAGTPFRASIGSIATDAATGAKPPASRRDAGGALNYLGLTPKWVDGTRPGSPGRPARARRSRIVRDSCPPRGAATLGHLRDGADHAWRGQPLRRRAISVISWHLQASPAILTSRSKRTICTKFRSGARVWRGVRFPPCCPPVSRSRPPVRPLRPPCKPRAVVSHTIPLVFDHQGFFTSYRRVSRPISFFSPCFPGLTRGVLTPIQWFRAALRSRRRPHD